MKGWDARLARDVEDYHGGPDDLWDGRVDIHQTFRLPTLADPIDPARPVFAEPLDPARPTRTYRITGTFEADASGVIDLGNDIDSGQLRVERLDALSVWVPVHRWDEPDDMLLWDTAYAVCDAAADWVWRNTTHDDDYVDDYVDDYCAFDRWGE
jgi:hypothetical protein